jgi:hypothetical protein
MPHEPHRQRPRHRGGGVSAATPPYAKTPTKQLRESNASQPPGHSGGVQQGSVGNSATRQTARNAKQSCRERANHPHATQRPPPHKKLRDAQQREGGGCQRRPHALRRAQEVAPRRTLAHTHTPCSFALHTAPNDPRAISGPSSSWPVGNTKASIKADGGGGVVLDFGEQAEFHHGGGTSVP